MRRRTNLSFDPSVKSYLLLRGSGLSKQDYVMHAGGDLSDYERIFVLLQCFAKQEATSHSSSIQTMSAHYCEFPSWYGEFDDHHTRDDETFFDKCI